MFSLIFLIKTFYCQCEINGSLKYLCTKFEKMKNRTAADR